EPGLTPAFFASTDGTGVALGAPAFADADTGLRDKDGRPLKPAGANSARFEGYLEAPAAGPYRFHVVLGKQNAEAELRFDHLPDPVLLSGTAAADGAELSGLLELKPGVPYRFTLALRKLNGGEAQLLVQSETLPKGSLARLTLHPRTAIEGGERAMVLLSKALQLLQSLDLNEREVRYLLTHAADFGNVNLSRLPARASEDTPAGARALFAQFLRLAGYARLKGDLAGGTDDLIGIFEARTLAQAYPLLAAITRRDEATVKATSEALFAAPSFSNEIAVERLWEALRIVERFGVPVSSIVDWTRIVNAAATPDQRFAIARDLREAIKARFDPEAWQRVAMPIFDRLRQRQRDALSVYVMHQHGFARREQLYEYFLIDPGMEPEVQTSRIRLAIASVQLFVQRCLLNLESKVHPSTIDSKQWEWMKRYRVWEANRKIFLFPENWLEPEFRDDKTHLFTELEGALLQDDVSNDLAEDAFLNYLKKLEELARLDIVAMHLEDNADPAQNTLHVIGRTYSEPHKYFYRRYAHQMWTPWEPVTAEIEGDHLAPVVWRDRLYLFWVTFRDRPNENPQTGTTTGDKTIANAKLSELMNDVKQAGMVKHLDAQLHWSEYLKGEWSTRKSGGFIPLTNNLSVDVHHPLLPGPDTVRQILILPFTVPLNFDPRSFLIYVSKEPYENGEERGVYIHLSLNGEVGQSFYLAGRNSTPVKADGGSPLPANPYSAKTALATRYEGSGALTVEFKRRIVTEEGKDPVPTVDTPDILRKGGDYTLLPCDNDITLGSPEIAALAEPVFYQDNAYTLFVEPSVTERTITDWEDWITPMPKPKPEWERPEWWKDIVVTPKVPRPRPIPVDPDDPTWRNPIGPESLISLEIEQDWLVNPRTGLLFEGELIAPGGRAGATVTPGIEAMGTRAGGGRLNVIDASGFNSTLARGLDALKDSAFGAGNVGTPRIGG
ncbi:MAG TPA: neuraminidase-like domain-containing protein, partial [Thermoanaerobaculia bacterium]